MKKLLAASLTLALSLNVSVAHSAWSQVNDVLTTSWQIRNTLDGGLKLIGGMQEGAITGQIAADGTLNPYFMNQADADAYNAALAAYEAGNYDGVTAESLVVLKTQETNQAMSLATGDFVQAAQQFITVTKLNFELSEAQSMNDNIRIQALRDTVAAGGTMYTIETTEVTAYNDSLVSFEQAAQNFAAFTALASSPDAIAALQTDLDANAITGADITDAFFDGATNSIRLSNVDSSVILSYDLSSFMATTADIELAGASSGFYTTGPTQDTACFVDSANCGAGGGGNQPPPNTLLYGDPDGDGIMQPTAYTDENGVIVTYAPGTAVYDPASGLYVGQYDANGVFICDGGNGMCTL